jgi:Fe-S oxidoreductase
MVFDLSSKEFWSQEALEKEFRRVFDICHGCRRCFNLCPSFESLFNLIDTKGEDVDNLTSRNFKEVVDLCYQCKLCFNHCPYTPPHRWKVDFPRLMLRSKAVEAKYHGVSLQDRVLGNTDLLGRLGSATAPLSNWANKNSAVRLVMEETIGIHRDRNLPEFHRETFSQWYTKYARALKPASKKSNGKVALFYTCSVNYNDPDVGKATVKVLEKNGVEVIVPEQKCCGMPYLDGGDIESALENVGFNLKHLNDAVKQGCDIVVPGPTCSYMLKQEYPTLSRSERAQAVSQRSYDICEYLMRLHEQGKLDTTFVQGQGTIAYQLPCHLRAQNIGYKSRDLMQLIPNTQVRMIQRCSAYDGTWGAKKEYYQLSLKWAEPLFKEINEAEADLVVSDCPLAGLQITKGTEQRPLHPIQVLARAYGLEEPDQERTKE